jgi:hypothetical protein
LAIHQLQLAQIERDRLVVNAHPAQCLLERRQVAISSPPATATRTPPVPASLGAQDTLKETAGRAATGV